jgi:hypothetical protein
MSTEDRLYRLIQTLNASEKGFFKKSAKNFSAKENVYIFLLFDIYNSLKEYDEEAIAKAIQKKGFPNQADKIKSELHQAILDSLKQYYKGNSASEKIQDLLSDAHILLKKNLYSEAKSKFTKAKKIASEAEYFDQWLQVIARERSTFALFTPNMATLEKQMTSSFEEEKKVFQYKNNENALFKGYTQLLSAIAAIGVQPITQIKEKALSAYQEITIDKINLSKRNELIYLSIEAKYFFINENFESFEKTEKILRKKIVEKEYDKCVTIVQQIAISFNFLPAYIKLNKTEGAEQIMDCGKQLCKKIAPADKDQIAAANNIIFVCERSINNNHKNYEEALTLCIQKLKSEKIDPKNLFSENIISLYYFIGLFHTALKNYKEAIKMLNQLYLKTNGDFGALKESEIIFLLTLCHIQLGNPDTVEVLCKDYLKSYEKNTIQLPLRKAMMDFVHKNPYLNKELIIKQFQAIVASHQEKDFAYDTDLLDMHHWVNSN